MHGKPKFHQVDGALAEIDRLLELTGFFRLAVTFFPEAMGNVTTKRAEEGHQPLLPLDDYGSFIKAELVAGHPFLVDVGIVRLWSILEAAVDGIAANVLIAPESLELESVRNLEGRLVDFLRADPNEQAELLAEELKATVKARQRVGVGRYQELLKPLGLGGTVHKSVSRALLELAEVRHVIVHRLGRCDKRLADRCSWLTLTPGVQIRLSPGALDLYATAAKWYLLEVFNRDRRRAGYESDAFTVEAQAKMLKRIAELEGDRTKSVPSGYWQRLATGRRVKRAPLPPLPE